MKPETEDNFTPESVLFLLLITSVFFCFRDSILQQAIEKLQLN
jgi:hypothetical protein